MKPSIEINSQFEQVLRFVNETQQIIFLTGKAGTGKTTLLKYVKENTFKQMAIVAPTGVAAINAGGSTIHSFFQFPFTPFLPTLKESGELDVAKTQLPTLKYNAQRLNIFRNLELLVIDEVSMVRADLLDQIDVTLRQTRKRWYQPFGGVQVMLIGDMYQLPPVVQQEEWQLLNSVYSSPFFFDSRVVKQFPPVYIELEKIYRQNEAQFINLLNKVRNNILDTESLEELNSHYKANLSQQDYQNNITLTTHNRKADSINSKNLEALPDKAFKFKCRVEGIFSDKNFPAEEELILKKGTRVMFLKNNAEKNYYNGKIGIVTFVNDETIKVKCDEDTNEIEVARETWTNVSYKLDRATKHIDEEILGTFTQFPLRLAWAITIHKSQGLTFDKLIIDAAESFSAGQVYVALSRCRSLSGLTLSSRISPQALMNDNNILNFSSTKQDEEQVQNIFSSSQREYIKTVLLALFDLSAQQQNRKDLGGVIETFKAKITTEGHFWAKSFFEKIDALNDVANKFKNQLSGLIDNATNIESDTNLQERIKKASLYFETELQNCLNDLRNCPLVTESKEAADEMNGILQTLFEALFQKHALIKNCANGFVFSEFVKNKLSLRYPDFRINVYASAKNTKVSADVKYPDLYRKLILLRDDICNDEQKPIYMVANKNTLTELANFLPAAKEDLLKISGFGEAKVNAYGDGFLKIIKEFMLENNLASNMSSKVPKKEKKTPEERNKENETKTNTKEITFQLYKQGLKPAEIAKERNLAVTTIETHLTPYVASGEININDLVSTKKQKIISEALQDFKYEDGLTVVKNKLPDDVSYSEIRYVLAGRVSR
ncbi:MAG: helix-turn-helix domain-containing protein [Bacteroidetes bacterium]|nr:helix-turn-helix domain-containing protein [Bacteroidota bacterium]